MRRYFGRAGVSMWGSLCVLLAAAAASLALAASASATITGEFGNFAQCPVRNPAAVACLYAKSTSGEFKISATAVPLSKPIVLQGGLAAENAEGISEVLPAANGETLSKTPQTVPGGLLKIVAPKFLPGFLQELFNEFINKGITGVTATTELVGKAKLNTGAALFGVGTALELPTRVHLENTFLGGSCYVGSASKPVTVDFTTGTTSPPLPNKPITGSPGEVSVSPEGIFRVTGNSLVNNTFAAPKAEGCGGIFSFLIDEAVDSELELPSASGHNTAILNGSQEIAAAEFAREHGV
ncbi:MAG: hypothetical protein WAU69_06400 [Solirubrobacteraceae bacterium]